MKMEKGTKITQPNKTCNISAREKRSFYNSTQSLEKRPMVMVHKKRIQSVIKIKYKTPENVIELMHEE